MESVLCFPACHEHVLPVQSHGEPSCPSRLQREKTMMSAGRQTDGVAIISKVTRSGGMARKVRLLAHTRGRPHARAHTHTLRGGSSSLTPRCLQRAGWGRAVSGRYPGAPAIRPPPAAQQGAVRAGGEKRRSFTLWNITFPPSLGYHGIGYKKTSLRLPAFDRLPHAHERA